MRIPRIENTSEKPSTKNIDTLNDAKPKAVQVTSGVVLGGIVGNEDVAKVKVDSKSKTTSEIQAPAGTPTVISLGGYSPGAKVVVVITQNGKSVNLGTFVAGPSGTLVLPAATLTGTANQEFSFKSGGKTAKVVLRPTAPEAGFSTLKAKFKK